MLNCIHSMRVLIDVALAPVELFPVSLILVPSRRHSQLQAEQPLMSGIYFLLYVTDHQL